MVRQENCRLIVVRERKSVGSRRLRTDRWRGDFFRGGAFIGGPGAPWSASKVKYRIRTGEKMKAEMVSSAEKVVARINDPPWDLEDA
jgi:hypothetical protein